MKFSHSLKFNSIPEWTNHYLNYEKLKKLIYTLEKQSIDDDNYSNDEEISKFILVVDGELSKVDTFYQEEEERVFGRMVELVNDVERFQKEGISTYRDEDLDSDGSGSDDDVGRRPTHKTDENNSVATSANEALTNSGGNLTSGGLGGNNFGSHATGHVATGAHNLRGKLFLRDEEESIGDFNGVDENHLDPAFTDPFKSSVVSGDDFKVTEYTPHSRRSSRAKSLKRNSQVFIPPQSLLSESRIFLRKRIINLFTSISELKSFIDLNKTGFKKALKKFDKSLNTNLKDDYLLNLKIKSYIFKNETLDSINLKIDKLIHLYSLINNTSFDLSKSELSIHLREHVVWERNTVWRDMISIERKSHAASESKKENNEILNFNFNIWNKTFWILILISLITLFLLKISPFNDSAQKNCFALIICASLLWATEAIPLFVTSLLVPLLVVNLNVLKNDDGSLMSSPDSSKFILSTMWNSVILLLLGGFTLAAALSKYHIAKVLSTMILSKAGTSPSIVLLTIMAVALFASMWVSNVAAPVLCFSLIQPLLRTLPKDSQFINALILGIALASNIGGMASPIASPQNIVAIGSMNPPPSWGQWFVIALPICLLSLLLIWIFLLITFDCNSKNTRLVPIRVINDKFTPIQWFIIAITIITIFLWCIASKLTGIFGEMGIIALIPIIIFFGTQLLSTSDFNNYPWNIVILAMGGTALGKAVSSSGLLANIAKSIQYQVQDFSLFGVTLTFGLLILIMATFVSHTVAALIIIPLVSEIGSNLPDPHPRLLIMVSALLCSAAMGLPTSGFPNVTAICMTDDFGKPYLTVSTFITRGVPASFIAYSIIVTVGFATMKLINF